MDWIIKASELSAEEKVAAIEKFNDELKALITRCMGILGKEDAGADKINELKSMMEKIQQNSKNIETTIRNRAIEVHSDPGQPGSELTSATGKGAGFDKDVGDGGGTGMPQ